MLVFFFSDYLERRYIEDARIKRILWPPFFLLCLITILIFLEPDLSTVIVIWLVVFIILYVGGVKLIHILGLGFIGAAVTIGYMFLEDYRRERLFAFFNGSNEAGGLNFRILLGAPI